jgi:uncharacterized protein (DUF433 family)
MYGTQGLRQTGPVLEPELGYTEDKTVTFLDFVQALAVRKLRNERRIPLQRIREAYSKAREDFPVIKYPFATEGVRVGLFGPLDRPDKQVLFICFAHGDDGIERYYQLTGKKRGNQLIGEVVMTYARFLDFDPTTKLACRYTSYKTDDGKVVMDPQILFGEPFVEATGYTAHALFNAYQTEGTFERAAKIYGVELKYVRLAAEYFDSLNLPPAA